MQQTTFLYPRRTSAIVHLVFPDHVCGTLCLSASVSLASPGQFRRALKRIYLTVSAGPSDFLFLGAEYK